MNWESSTDMYTLCLVAQSCLTLQPHGQPNGLQPTRLLTPWEFSRQEYWSGLPCPPPEDIPNPGTEPVSPALKVDYLSLSHLGSCTSQQSARVYFVLFFPCCHNLETIFQDPKNSTPQPSHVYTDMCEMHTLPILKNHGGLPPSRTGNSPGNLKTVNFVLKVF